MGRYIFSPAIQHRQSTGKFHNKILKNVSLQSQFKISSNDFPPGSKEAIAQATLCFLAQVVVQNTHYALTSKRADAIQFKNTLAQNEAVAGAAYVAKIVDKGRRYHTAAKEIIILPKTQSPTRFDTVSLKLQQSQYKTQTRDNGALLKEGPSLFTNFIIIPFINQVFIFSSTAFLYKKSYFSLPIFIQFTSLLSSMAEGFMIVTRLNTKEEIRKNLYSTSEWLKNPIASLKKTILLFSEDPKTQKKAAEQINAIMEGTADAEENKSKNEPGVAEVIDQVIDSNSIFLLADLLGSLMKMGADDLNNKPPNPDDMTDAIIQTANFRENYGKKSKISEKFSEIKQNQPNHLLKNVDHEENIQYNEVIVKAPWVKNSEAVLSKISKQLKSLPYSEGGFFPLSGYPNLWKNLKTGKIYFEVQRVGKEGVGYGYLEVTLKENQITLKEADAEGKRLAFILNRETKHWELEEQNNESQQSTEMRCKRSPSASCLLLKDIKEEKIFSSYIFSKLPEHYRLNKHGIWSPSSLWGKKRGPYYIGKEGFFVEIYIKKGKYYLKYADGKRLSHENGGIRVHKDKESWIVIDVLPDQADESAQKNTKIVKSKRPDSLALFSSTEFSLQNQPFFQQDAEHKLLAQHLEEMIQSIGKGEFFRSNRPDIHSSLLIGVREKLNQSVSMVRDKVDRALNMLRKTPEFKRAHRLGKQHLLSEEAAKIIFTENTGLGTYCQEVSFLTLDWLIKNGYDSALIIDTYDLKLKTGHAMVLLYPFQKRIEFNDPKMAPFFKTRGNSHKLKDLGISGKDFVRFLFDYKKDAVLLNLWGTDPYKVNTFETMNVKEIEAHLTKINQEADVGRNYNVFANTYGRSKRSESGSIIYKLIKIKIEGEINPDAKKVWARALKDTLLYQIFLEYAR